MPLKIFNPIVISCVARQSGGRDEVAGLTLTHCDPSTAGQEHSAHARVTCLTTWYQ